MKYYELKPGCNRTMLLGNVYKVGDRVAVENIEELPAADRAMLETHFQCVLEAESTKPGRQEPKRLRNGLTEEQARQKLLAAGVVHAASVPVEDLAELYEKVFAVYTGGHGAPRMDVPTDPPGAAGETPEMLAGLAGEDLPPVKTAKPRRSQK